MIFLAGNLVLHTYFPPNLLKILYCLFSDFLKLFRTSSFWLILNFIKYYIRINLDISCELSAIKCQDLFSLKKKKKEKKKEMDSKMLSAIILHGDLTLILDMLTQN